MSTPPDKPAPRVKWETIERVAAKADADRIEAMSEEELDAMLGNAGFDAGAADRAAAGALARRRRRPRWVVPAIAAAVVLVLLLAWKRREVVAWLTGTPEPISPDRWDVPREPTREERAETLRGEAFAACARSEWEACLVELDQAKELDPGGDGDPRVTRARDAIRQAPEPDAGAADKPVPP